MKQDDMLMAMFIIGFEFLLLFWRFTPTVGLSFDLYGFFGLTSLGASSFYDWWSNRRWFNLTSGPVPLSSLPSS